MSFSNAEDELLQKAAAARDDEYWELVERAIRVCESSFGQSRRSGLEVSIAFGSLAEKRSPREATRLRHIGLEWIERYPAVEAMKAMEAREIAEVYAHLARFQTGPPADTLFAK